MSYRDIIINNNVPFDEILIPSKGIFYNNKKNSFLVKYLTGKEENILTSPTLIDSGKAVEMVMSSCILDWEDDVKDILLGDINAVIIYLRSTSYGDNIKYEHECPKCKYINDNVLTLSSLEMKDVEVEPDENGLFTFVLPKMKIQQEQVIIKFRPKTLGDEIKILNEVENNKKVIGDIVYDKRVEITYKNQIVSVNDNYNKNFILNVIKNMPLGDSLKFREFIEKVEPGINNLIHSNCINCGFVQKNKIPIDYNFIKLDGDYRENMMEEIFLISYYGKGGFIRSDIFNIPINERRWILQRIQEEVDKKNKAEREAVNKAKSQSNSRKM
jgi:hypothetical protein